VDNEYLIYINRNYEISNHFADFARRADDMSPNTMHNPIPPNTPQPVEHQPQSGSRCRTATESGPHGFTRIELMVVIAAIVILAELLVPGLASGNKQAEGVQCQNNLRQLGQGWLMYDADNRTKFPGNGGEGDQGPDTPLSAGLRPGGVYSQWCPGRQDPGAGDGPGEGGYLSSANLPPNQPNVGQQWIQAGLIYPYVKNLRVYLCPADESFNLVASVQHPHVRSVSMNAWVAPLPYGTENGQTIWGGWR
jgi:type II secretory pathway pseudopilin PulG